MADRITSMEVFARVASLGSLSAAARALGMSQTMATKHIAALEDRLGTKLLHRTTRRVSLTETGRSYLDAIESILDDLAAADAQASRNATEVRGQLRLNAPVSFGTRQIAPHLPQLCDRYPNLTVDLGLIDRQVNLVEEGWDLVIRIGEIKEPSLIARRLTSSPLTICASPDYLERRGRPTRVAELSKHNCLGYTLSRQVGAGRWHFGADGRRSVTVTGTMQANNGDALVAAAVSGHGIIYQPMFLVREALDDGTLVQLDIDHPPIAPHGVYAVYPSDRRPPAKVRAAIDFFVEAFAANGKAIPDWGL